MQSPDAGLEYLKQLQKQLTYLTLRVQAEKAAVKRAEDDAANATRILEGKLSVKTKASSVDHAR
jgi:hypothetical protein